MSRQINKTISLSVFQNHTDLPDALKSIFIIHKSGNHDAAKQQYSTYLQTNARSPAAILLYGIAEAQSGSFARALSIIHKASQSDSISAIACYYLGQVHLQLRDAINAARSFLLADSLGIEEAHQQYNKAYKSATAKNKITIAQYHVDLMLQKGRTNQAINVVLKLMHENKRDARPWNLLCHVLKYTRFDNKPESNVYRVITQAFARERMNFKHMLKAAVSAMEYAPELSQLFACESGSPAVRARLRENILSGKLKSVLTNSLLLSILNKTILADARIEQWLLAVRYTLLDIVISDDSEKLSDKSYVKFMCALSSQCFLNEHVYFVTNDEFDKLKGLSKELNDIEAPIEILTPKLLIYSMYAALVRHEKHNELPALHWPDSVKKIIAQQIIEPKIELDIRGKIEQATEIDERASQLVQQQYEENPFPCWNALPAEIEKITINQLIMRLFPHVKENELADSGTANILVAGCGTGWIPVVLSSQIKDARITAIDLSLSSLSFAIRKIEELSLDNIQFRQGDILRLRELGEKFDHINCFGVLHHMEKTIDGFRVLADIIKPGCTMLIGLYSKIARESIHLARDYVQEKGYAATPEGMRQCRKDIFELDDDHTMKQLTEAIAFYSMSDFRDLVFHVREHCITTLELGEIVNALGLNFLGFEIHDQYISKLYRSMYPDDPNMVSFENWHQFEQKYPRTFVACYRFWVQKPQ